MESKDTTSKVEEQGLKICKAIILFKNFLDICLKENI